MDVWATPVAGGELKKLTSNPAADETPRFTRDGRFLVLQVFGAATSGDIWLLSLDGEHKPSPLLKGLANEFSAALSPDNRWLAYISDESGKPQYFVQSFPASGDRYQLSLQGTFVGTTVPSPLWLKGETQFAYLGPDGVTLMVADVTTEDGFRASAPRRLFKLPAGVRGLCATADGMRLLATVPSGGGNPETITLVQNWAAELGH